MNQQNKIPNLWPYAIIGFFVLAIMSITVWVSFAMQNDMELVREDYYEEEVRYQQQIDRVKRTSALNEQVSLAYDAEAQMLHLRIPESGGELQAEGVIHFYRPSDASLDQRIDLALGPDGTQAISVEGLKGGFWKVNVSWARDGKEYFTEKPVVLSGVTRTR